MTERTPDLTEFTPEQREALRAGGAFAEQLRDITAAHYPEGFNPYAADLNAEAASVGIELDPLRAATHFLGRAVAVTVTEGVPPDVWIMNTRYGDPLVRPFGEVYPTSFPDDFYAPYRGLPVDFMGIISHGTAGTRVNDQFRVYVVEQPDNPETHHTGVVVAMHMAALGREDRTPPGSSVAEMAAITQQRVLSHVAEHEPDDEHTAGPLVAKHLYAPLNQPVILAARDTNTLAAALRSAAERGEDIL